MKEWESIFAAMGKAAKEASCQLGLLPTDVKNDLLVAIADALESNIDPILASNELDMNMAEVNHVAPVMLDRLRLTKERIMQMAEGVRQVANLPDPIGRTIESIQRPNGLRIDKRTVPIGVIAMIYEARPNVTLDAAVLALKTGNAVILRGGKEAYHSSLAIVNLIARVLESHHIPEKAVQLVSVLDRDAVPVLLQGRQWIDLVIPRGSAGLIRRVVECSRIPVIETGAGICHVYVDDKADLNKAIPIIVNAKLQRPSVCNSMETLLVHRDIAKSCLLALEKAFSGKHVTIMGDAFTSQYMTGVQMANEQAYDTEYNDYILNVKVVESLEEAIQHIQKHGTHHSEAIITEDRAHADQFMNQVDASTVYLNASTRFTDGFEFGLGAEIGISTQKLHARGPMGLEALTSYKFYVYGQGQIRQ